MKNMCRTTKLISLQLKFHEHTGLYTEERLNTWCFSIHVHFIFSYLVIFWGSWVQRPPKKQFCNYTSKGPCINGFTKWQTKNNLWCSVEMKESSIVMTLTLKELDTSWPTQQWCLIGIRVLWKCKRKVCIRAKWSNRTDVIPVSVAWND